MDDLRKRCEEILEAEKLNEEQYVKSASQNADVLAKAAIVLSEALLVYSRQSFYSRLHNPPPGILEQRHYTAVEALSKANEIARGEEL